MRYVILLILTSVLWAGNFVAGKFIVGHASPLSLTDIRYAIAVVCLIPVVLVADKKLFPPRRAIFPLLLMGLTGVAAFNLFTYLALERTTPDNVGLLSALNPISIAIASFIFLREKLSARQVLGMLVSLFGVVVVVTQGQLSQLSHFELNSGVLMMLIAVGTWGLYAVVSRFAMNYVSPYMATLWAGALGVICALPFDLPTFSLTHTSSTFWIAMLYSAIGGTVVAMILWNIGIQRVGGTKSGMFLNFNPIFTALLAFVLMGETVQVSQVIGTVIVIIGVSLFAMTRKRRPREVVEG